MSGLLTAAIFLNQQLSANATLAAAPGGIWIEADPQGEDYPLIQAREIARPDTATQGQFIVMERPIYVVTAIGQVENDEALVAYADAIHTALHQVKGQLANGQVFYCARVAFHRMRYENGGLWYRELGGRYQVWTDGP